MCRPRYPLPRYHGTAVPGSCATSTRDAANRLHGQEIFRPRGPPRPGGSGGEKHLGRTPCTGQGVSAPWIADLVQRLEVGLQSPEGMLCTKGYPTPRRSTKSYRCLWAPWNARLSIPGVEPLSRLRGSPLLWGQSGLGAGPLMEPPWDSCTGGCRSFNPNHPP